MDPDANVEPTRLQRHVFSRHGKFLFISTIAFLSANNLLSIMKIHEEVGARSCDCEGFAPPIQSEHSSRIYTKMLQKMSFEADANQENTETDDPQLHKRSSRPLNIVVFFPDDMSHKSLQDVSGPEYVETPFLSALARDGIRFTRNAVTTSICWMSRATLFTGLHGEFEK